MITDIMIQYGIAFEYTPFEDIPVELQPYVEEYGEEYRRFYVLSLEEPSAMFSPDRAISMDRVLNKLSSFKAKQAVCRIAFEEWLDAAGIKDKEALYEMFHEPDFLVFYNTY